MFRGEAASAATILRHGGLWVRQVETRYYLTPGQPRRQRKEILSRAEDSSNTGLAGSAERIEVHCNGQGVPSPTPSSPRNVQRDAAACPQLEADVREASAGHRCS